MVQSLPHGVATSYRKAQLIRLKLGTYFNQLRRLIAGAVLAFGCYQGLFLRRQRPLRVLAPCRISAFRHVDRAFLRAYFSMDKFHSKITKKSLSGHVFFFLKIGATAAFLQLFALPCVALFDFYAAS